ncbi:hypothetical protein [Geomonas anaerohicana]|uniref:Uncharacterized protein n=1 Tax=Geomonas anaerohicana TaxID=2798583 RepID=A0ABS0YA28_9BACT|nr:hypothetical protein [Geomonas anaerohicana]MBJ6749130.1 hypothetical protein [Geomonas anaerohicana]
MAATIRVSSGNLYDYVLIGEHPKATDGFDNAYDTISPGNLNASMGEPYISVIVPHPDWKPAMRELRGDIRTLAKKQEWQLLITSSLAKGTPLVIALTAEQSSMPRAMRLTLRDEKTEADLRKGGYTIPAPGPGIKTKILIVVEQP